VPEDVHISSALVVTILVVLWTLFWLAKKAWPGVTALVLFFRSWNGYVDTDGTKVPGVVESIVGLRADVADLKGDVGAAARAAGAAQVTADESLKMLKPNGGGSLRDAVDRVAAAQDLQSDQLAAVVDDLAELKHTLAKHMTDSRRITC
jgi:ABC-type amino acid transport substrate-binding protein